MAERRTWYENYKDVEPAKEWDRAVEAVRMAVRIVGTTGAVPQTELTRQMLTTAVSQGDEALRKIRGYGDYLEEEARYQRELKKEQLAAQTS